MAQGGFVEIRIHGVNGTPPANMLELPGPEAVQRELSYTDNTTSFFVARPQYADPGSHPVEAYSWGSLTAGSGGISGPIIRAGWLLLLPFALVNVAYWSRPKLDWKTEKSKRETEESEKIAWSRSVTACAVKWAGLMFTMLIVTSACVLAIDMLAIGCFRPNATDCDSWATWPFSWGDAGDRVFVAALGVLAMLGVLFWLSRRTKNLYEAVPDGDPGGITEQVGGDLRLDVGEVDEGVVLRRRKMWQGQDRVSRLQLVHLAVGISTVALYGSMTITTGQGRKFAAILAIVALAVATTAIALGVGDGNDFAGDNPRSGAAKWWTYASVGLAVIALSAFLVTSFATNPRVMVDPQEDGAPGTVIPILLYTALWSIIGFCAFASRAKWLAFGAALIPWALLLGGFLFPDRNPSWITIGVAAAVVMFIVFVGVIGHRRTRMDGHAWGGAAPGMILGAALVIGTLYTLAAVFSVSWILGEDRPPSFNVDDLARSVYEYGRAPASTEAPAATELSPRLLDWLAIGMLPWLLVLFVVIVGRVFGLKFWREAKPAISAQRLEDNESEAAFQPPQISGVALEKLEKKRVGKRMLAARAHRTERLLGLAAVVTILAGYSVILATAVGDPPWKSPLSLSRLSWHIGSWKVFGWETLGSLLTDLTAAGILAAFLASLGLVFVASRVRGSASVRRSVAVLWDITTFMPRTAHPFSPPCYAERVVPEVTRRVREVISNDQKTVILSGHSQGAVIAVAAASRLSDSELQDVRLITYGTQLRAWFGKIYPGVLGSWALGNQRVDVQWDFSKAQPDAPWQTEASEPGNSLPDYPEGDREPTSLLARMLAANAGGETRPWVNLYRRTDPIGFRVFADKSCAADVYLSEADTELQLSDPKLITTHSSYPTSKVYRAVIWNWAGDP